MFILITYDVNITSEDGSKRLRQVAKVCRDYGKRVQNSVFECVVTDAQFVTLRDQIRKIIQDEQDSVRFYFLGSNWKRRIETLGKNNGIDFTGELIV